MVHLIALYPLLDVHLHSCPAARQELSNKPGVEVLAEFSAPTFDAAFDGLAQSMSTTEDYSGDLVGSICCRRERCVVPSTM